MLVKHEPYPMVVMDCGYNLLRTNTSADKILQLFVAKPSQINEPVNLLEMIFNPRLCRSFIVDWQKTAHVMLSRLHRESLANTYDDRLRLLIDTLMGFPEVPQEWRQPDFSDVSDTTLTLKRQRGEWEFSFLRTMTNFSAPPNINY